MTTTTRPTPLSLFLLPETVTVCSACLQASCWQGEFYCEDYKTAGTIDKPIGELIERGLEHPSYWRPGR